jgi:hypothetical protein
MSKIVTVSNNAQIMTRIAKGWKPNLYLTNMGIAYFQQMPYVARTLFPIVPVPLQSSYYYKFDRADLARIQVHDKPQFGKVAPAQMGQTDDSYATKVKQIIVGLDQINNLNFQRTNAAGVADPRRARTQFVSEQTNIYLDYVFAQKYFKAGVWSNQLTGVASAPAAGQFLQFNDAASDPIGVISGVITDMKRRIRRKPNKIGLGTLVYDEFKKHPDLLERVKYTGTTANPAKVNEQVLAQLFEVEQVVVLESTYNAAGDGENENMQFICDPKGILICYAPPAAAIDVPSAGYIFAWDMLGDGNWLAVDQFEGEGGTHSDYIEGLISVDMKIVANDCGTYLANAVQ